MQGTVLTVPFYFDKYFKIQLYIYKINGIIIGYYLLGG